MQTLLIKISGAFILCTLIFYAGWKVCSWRYDSQYKKAYDNAIAQVQAQQIKNNELSEKYQKQLNDYQKQSTKVNENVKTEIVTHTVYASCMLPTSGLQLINSTVDQANKVISTL